jgi:protein-tyrosine phosphatase
VTPRSRQIPGLHGRGVRAAARRAEVVQRHRRLARVHANLGFSSGMGGGGEPREGSALAVLSDRVIRWEGFCNARDLGGLPTVTGGSTRYRRLIRSADTRLVTASGWEQARDAGVRVVIDLRNPDEVEPRSRPAATLGAGTFAVPAARAAAARPAGIQTILIPIDDVEDLGLWRRLNTEGLNGTPLYYRPFLDAKPERIAAALTAIARTPGGVIFHCGAGRDRTGLISLLLLALAGVTPEAIVADYELSLGQVAPLYAALGLEQDELDVREQVKSRGTTVGETITSLVRGLDVAGYLAAAGVCGADIGALRGRLL